MQQGIPAPPVLHSPADPTAMLAGWSALAAAAFGVAVWLSVRNRDPLPVVACVGALVCTLNEPIYDILGNLVYTQSPDVAYHAFGRAIPWTLVVGYVPWVGLMPYLLYRLMASGVPRTRLHQIAAGLIGSVLLIEIVNALWLKDWKYYGESSWRGVLGGGVIQMAAMPLLLALLYFMLAHGARGWRRALAGLVLPAMALPMVFAGTSWPLYISNHANLPTAVDWAAAALSIAFCFVAVPVITSVAARWYSGELALGRVARPAPARVEPVAPEPAAVG